MFKRSLSRGTSIVAALALVGVLSIALLVTQILLPSVNTSSQSAAVASTQTSKPAIPGCNNVTDGTKVIAKSEEDAKKQPCVCQIPATASTPRTFQSLKYTVTAQLQAGNATAVTTVSKTGTPATENSKCVVEYCKAVGGASSCTPATQSLDSLGGALASANSQVVQDFPKDIAQGLASGTIPPETISGKVSSETQQSISNAFDDLKAENKGIFSDTYSDAQISSAQQDLDNIATCGQQSCPGTQDLNCSGSNGATCIPAGKDDPVKLNGDLSTSQDTLKAQCDAGNCDARDLQTLAKLESNAKAQNSYNNLKEQCDAGNCDARDLATLKKLQEQAANNQTFKPSAVQTPQAPVQEVPDKGTGGGLGDIGKALQGFLGGLMKGLGGAGGAAAGPACPADPNAYAQQQQQYQAQLQQYNYQMQQYQYQQQYGGGGYQVVSTNPVVVVPTSGGGSVAPPIAPVPCTPSSSSNTCAATPAQPTTACPSGTVLKPVTSQGSNGATCTTGWQCGASNATAPVAQLSCQPQVADVGMTITISYGCTNATGSTGGGFFTGGATSGSTTTVITAPPTGVTKATYGITCTNQNLSGQASCDVQVSRPSIVLLANPKVVATSTASTIGWVTSGMSSCVVSSPQQADFTAANAGNTSVNGMATTSPITRDTTVLLHCVTLGGGTRDATTTITSSAAGGGDQTGSVNITSSADGTSIARGATNTIRWSSTGVPAGSKMSLWLYDVHLDVVTALIKNELSASSTYAWTLPTPDEPCSPDLNFVCGTDLVPGRQYGIEADLYTGDVANASYGAQAYTPHVFTITQ